MSQGLFPRIATELDLNGPTLSFTNNPVGVVTTSAESVTLSGFATVTFASTATPDNTGTISYQWYEVGVGDLSDSTRITGTGTTQLTISDIITPDDNGRKFFLQADYNPTIGGQTGNALNEPLSSGIGTITVIPNIQVFSQPDNTQTFLNEDTTVTIDAGLTDSTFGGVAYQWQLNGENIDDGSVVVEPLPSKVEVLYTDDGSITLPSDARDVEITVAGSGGGQGSDDDSTGKGAFGADGRAGQFSYVDGERTLTFEIGRLGNAAAGRGKRANALGGISEVAKGGIGGKRGPYGKSGNGGGGGGATGVFDSVANEYTIVSGAGGGGAGGTRGTHSKRSRTAKGDPAPEFLESDTIVINPNQSSGDPGKNNNAGSNSNTSPGDGGGGGGGGGGVEGGTGGEFGRDTVRAAESGNPGTSKYNVNYITNLNSEWTNSDTGFVYIRFTTNEIIPGINEPVPRTTTFSGTKSPTLTIKTDNIGIQTVRCIVTSNIDSGFTFSEAPNSPVLSDTVNFAPISNTDQSNINIETIGADEISTLNSINLFNGEYEFVLSGSDLENNLFSKLYSIYAPDKDLEVEMDLYGGKGNDKSGRNGGEGGFSRIRFTMAQNTEYVIAGLTEDVNTPYIYRKGTLIACVGGGGNASNTGSGGDGGGIEIDGTAGTGAGNPGTGGVSPDEGTLPSDGIFGSLTDLVATGRDVKASSPEGGRALRCTKGQYWAEQNISACNDVPSDSEFILFDGTPVVNTSTSISRGYKDGLNIIQTAGEAVGSNGGNGGNGATGGGGGDSAGGGGGSGYTNGEVTILYTQLGGSNGTAKVILRNVTS